MARAEGIAQVPARRRSRGRPTPDDAARIDADILDVARDMFFVHGYERTSMAMIVRAAGVSKTTLYARYETKGALFRATVMLTVERVAEEVILSSAVRRTEDLDQGLRAFGYDALRICLSPLWSNYERLVMAEGPRFPELTDAVGDRAKVAITDVGRFIAECAERDGVPCGNPEAAASIYILAIRGFFSAAILRNSVPPRSDCIGYIDRLVDVMMASRHTW